jgi:HEAT repeat protein
LQLLHEVWDLPAGETLGWSLSALRNIENAEARWQAMLAILGNDHSPFVLAAVRDAMPVPAVLNAGPVLRHFYTCSKALEELAPHLPEPLLAQALQRLLGGGEGEARTEALGALARHLGTRPPSFLWRLWDQTLPALANRTRADLLTDLRALLPILVRLGGAPAVAESFRAVQDVRRWWP